MYIKTLVVWLIIWLYFICYMILSITKYQPYCAFVQKWVDAFVWYSCQLFWNTFETARFVQVPLCWFPWRFDAHWVIAMDVPIRHGYFVFRVALRPRIRQSARDIAPLAKSMISIVARIVSCNEPYHYYGFREPGPYITNVIATCRKNFSQWESSFLWKLRYHWLKFLRRVEKNLSNTGPWRR